MKKDAKDILRDIKAEMEGVSPKDIQFKDLRDNKKRKKKKKEKNSESENKSVIIKNQEGFSIIGAEAKFCDYREIGKKSKLKEKSSLEEWGPFDFFRFAHDLYLKKYKTNWDLNIAGNSLEISRIKDKFYDLFGFCCNLIIRDYIVFFFDNHIDDFIREKGDFYFSQMRKDWIILSFKEIYDFQESFKKYMIKEKQKNKKYSLTKEEIEKSFLMGDVTLVGDFGVVVSLNWLLVVKKMSKKKAIKLVVDACKYMYKKNMIGVVKNATETYSPYPSNLIFKSPQLVFNKIDKSIQLNIEFVNNNKMEFLQKNN